MAMSDGSEQGYGMVDRGASTDIKIGAVPTTTGGGGGCAGASATMDVDRLWGHRESADQRFGEIVGMERYALCEQNYLLVDKQRVHAWDKHGIRTALRCCVATRRSIRGTRGPLLRCAPRQSWRTVS